MISAVIVAGGSGKRMGAGENKVFLTVAGKSILAHTVEAFENIKDVDEIIIVTRREDILRCRELFDEKKIQIVCGGKERRDSVRNGILASRGDTVLIHDGARCCVREEDINRVIADCERYGAAALGVACKDTLKSSDDDGFITGTIDREKTWLIQTPQVFSRETILNAHMTLGNELFTDDCAMAERMGVRIKITSGSYDNIKVTTPDDLIMAERILNKRKE